MDIKGKKGVFCECGTRLHYCELATVLLQFKTSDEEVNAEEIHEELMDQINSYFHCFKCDRIYAVRGNPREGFFRGEEKDV